MQCITSNWDTHFRQRLHNNSNKRPSFFPLRRPRPLPSRPEGRYQRPTPHIHRCGPWALCLGLPICPYCPHPHSTSPESRCFSGRCWLCTVIAFGLLCYSDRGCCLTKGFVWFLLLGNRDNFYISKVFFFFFLIADFCIL